MSIFLSLFFVLAYGYNLPVLQYAHATDYYLFSLNIQFLYSKEWLLHVEMYRLPLPSKLNFFQTILRS